MHNRFVSAIEVQADTGLRSFQDVSGRPGYVVIQISATLRSLPLAHISDVVRDHRPYWLLKLNEKFVRLYTAYFLAPHFESLGPNATFMKPWNVLAHGGHVKIGNNIHVVADSHRKVTFSTWAFDDHQGHIEIGDNVLVCPGTRFDSASSITIGDNCMFAAGAYITDADWHDIYDRTRVIGTTKPVTLEDNTWIGDGAIVCKGVTVGKNSVVGAGSVVTADIPANVIAAGNPARVIRPLDDNRELVTRASLFADMDELDRRMDAINRHLLQHNTAVGWLRTKVRPRRGD